MIARYPLPSTQLFPESIIKSAVDTLKEVAIDDFKSEHYERAVKHLTVALSLDEKSHVLYSNRCTGEHNSTKRCEHAQTERITQLHRVG